jgi:insulysin
VKPLFLADTVDRELRAVDSENKKNLQSDTWRLHQLNKSLSNPEHPFCHFSTGNYKTLHDEPLERGVHIRDEFINFYEKHYSANRMKLVVLGRESLNELESWTEELFADVPNQDLPQNRWDHVQPFTEKELGMQVFAKPVFHMRSLDLYFPYPDEEDYYDSQPGRYLSHLIGHEGPGSILALIKSKGWATGLGAGASGLCPGSAFFSISIRLTEDGLKHYEEVAETVFQYISVLKETPPQEWIFDEMKQMSEVNFRFRQKSPASKTTSALANVMQRPLPRDYLLSGLSLLRKWDPEGIKRGLSHLHPDNFRLTIVSQEFPGDWDQKEKWYGTEYKYVKMSEDFMSRIRKAASADAGQRSAELHLPAKNEFIPSRLEVERKDGVEPTKTPKLIRNDDRVRTWYKKDDQFWVPKANLKILLRSPLVVTTPRSAVLAQLYQALVKDALSDYAYAAEISGLEYEVTSMSSGLHITLAGYNDKMAVLLEKVLVQMRDLEVSSERFRIVKERLIRGYKNAELQQPYHQVGVYTRWLTIEQVWVTEQLLAELPDITEQDVRSFFPEVLRQLHIEVLAHGNLYREDALRFTDVVENTLRPRKLPPAQWPIKRSMIYPTGCNYVYKKELKDPANVNHCIEYLLYVGNAQDRSLRAKVLLLGQIADEPCFDQLRTKEQLGYVVFSGASLHNTWLGYRILIQSERTPEYLEARIDSFLNDLGSIIRDMPNDKFEKLKNSLINKRLERLKNLSSECNRFSTHILNEAYDFEQGEHLTAENMDLTQANTSNS